MGDHSFFEEHLPDSLINAMPMSVKYFMGHGIVHAAKISLPIGTGINYDSTTTDIHRNF